MFLIPRFYYIINKNNHILYKDKRMYKKRYFVDETQKSQRFFVYYDNLCDGKFINIEKKFYYRPDWDISRDWVYNNICLRYYDIKESEGHIMFQRNTKDLRRKYPYNQDLYRVFYSFEDFKDWMEEDDTKFLWIIFPHKKYNIDAHKEMFLAYIQAHFEETNGNIFLLKIKFKQDGTL